MNQRPLYYVIGIRPNPCRSRTASVLLYWSAPIYRPQSGLPPRRLPFHNSALHSPHLRNKAINLTVHGYPAHGDPSTGLPPSAVQKLTGLGSCLALGSTPTSMTPCRPSAMLPPSSVSSMKGLSPPAWPWRSKKSSALRVQACVLVL